MNEENKAEIIDSSLELEEDKIQDLIDSCPVGVIEKE